MILILIDVHCHANLYLTIEEIIKEALSSGVEKIIAVAMSALSQERILEVSDNFGCIYPALGVHPEEVQMNPKIESQLDQIIEKIRKNRNKICAIGEIGLDHHFVRNKDLYPLQKTIFDSMLSIAQELELPVNLHVKGAEKLAFETLPSYKLPNVNIHWYSGPEDYLKLGIERGYFFSITPAIKNSPAVKKVSELVDEKHLLLESDGPVKYSGRTGTPAMIKEVLQAISKIKKISTNDLEKQIETNTQTIFPRIFN